MPKPKKPERSPLELEIASREQGIKRLKGKLASMREQANQRIELIREQADEQIAATERRIAKSAVLLDALKRGALKP